MSSRLLNRFISEHLGPPLAELGFQRRGGTWNRTSGQFTQVVEAQVATYAEPGNESFTINLGIFWARTYEIWPEKPVPEFPETTDCVVAVRVGHLLGDFSRSARDVWWTITGAEDLQPLQQEISSSLSSKGLPFLDGFRSLQVIRDFLETKERWLLVSPALRLLYLALVRAELGDIDGAWSALASGKNLPRDSSAWDERAEIVARQIGLREG